MSWCDHIGGKLIDESIGLEEIMKNFIRPKIVETRPNLVALSLEWPWEIFLNTSDEKQVEYKGSKWPIFDADLEITSFEDNGPITFKICTPDWNAGYELKFENAEITFLATGQEVSIVSRQKSMLLSEFLTKKGVTIHFEQDAMVVPPGILLKPDREIAPFDVNRLQVIDWASTNIRKESQGQDRDQTTVQARVIQHISRLEDWDIVLDDDGSGEIADIVAIRSHSDELIINLIHCKYSSHDNPGARVKDLYEVCGQAQKSARWRRDINVLFRHLIRRERKRVERVGKSGFEEGDIRKLYELEEQSRFLKPNFKITIAQPGLSSSKVSTQQLELLATTEVYLYETAYSDFEVICSS